MFHFDLGEYIKFVTPEIVQTLCWANVKVEKYFVLWKIVCVIALYVRYMFSPFSK